MSGEFKRDDGGRFSGEVTEQDILLVFDAEDAEGPLTTREVSDHLPIGRRATHNRLDAMHEAGLLEKKEMGNRVVWWAAVAPRLDPGLQAELEDSEDDEEYISLDDLEARLAE